MSQPQPPKIQMSNLPEYREGYANSVQIRVNLWDFFLLFGLVNQTAPDNVNIQNFQGVYLSPQQAKALLNVLQQNVTQYETAFGEIKLEPHPPPPGPSSDRGACLRRRRIRPETYLFFLALFALIVFLSHAPLLRLPYYWDELGQFVPAALDHLSRWRRGFRTRPYPTSIRPA